MSRRTSTSSFLHAAMNFRPSSVTVSTLTHTSASNAVAFQSPTMPNARTSFGTQSVHSFSFPPRPLCTAPSRFVNTIRFGNHPPLIRMTMSVPLHAHKKYISRADDDERSPPTHKHTQKYLVREIVSMLQRPVIPRTRLYEVIGWSGLLMIAKIQPVVKR